MLTTWPPRPVFVTLVKVCSVWQASNYFFSFIESVLAISDENNMQLDSFCEELKVRELFLYQLLLTLQLFCISKKDTKIIVFVKTLLLSGGTIEMEYSLIQHFPSSSFLSFTQLIYSEWQTLFFSFSCNLRVSQGNLLELTLLNKVLTSFPEMGLYKQLRPEGCINLQTESHIFHSQLVTYLVTYGNFSLFLDKDYY